MEARVWVALWKWGLGLYSYVLEDQSSETGRVNYCRLTKYLLKLTNSCVTYNDCFPGCVPSHDLERYLIPISHPCECPNFSSGVLELNTSLDL